MITIISSLYILNKHGKTQLLSREGTEQEQKSLRYGLWRYENRYLITVTRQALASSSANNSESSLILS